MAGLLGQHRHASIDVVIADPVSLPLEHERHYVERVARLPANAALFRPPRRSRFCPKQRPLPALDRGYVTFGSFQRLTKINDAVLRLWAAVLASVPGSRLRLQASQFGDESARLQTTERLRRFGVESETVDLLAAMPRGAYLAAHGEVDVILDTFPHTGATTTCESLWMGVPTLTLAGATMLAARDPACLPPQASTIGSPTTKPRSFRGLDR